MTGKSRGTEGKNGKEVSKNDGSTLVSDGICQCHNSLRSSKDWKDETGRKGTHQNDER